MNKLLAAFALLPMALWAQPQSVEVFGLVGVVRAAEDEGSLGTGVAYGGALTIPIFRRLAVDLDVQSGKPRRDFGSGAEFRSTQTLISPSLVYRIGSERRYFFAGGGYGAEFTTWESRFQTYNPDASPGIEVTESDSNGGLWNGKVGFVAAVRDRLLLRADLLLAGRFVVPHVAARFGVGYRF